MLLNSVLELSYVFFSFQKIMIIIMSNLDKWFSYKRKIFPEVILIAARG